MIGAMSTAPEAPLCRRCSRPVRVSRSQFQVFEQMHYVCFHYEFEHGDADVDADCGAPGCPSGVLPTSQPSADAQAALDDAIRGLREPCSTDGWTVELERPGVARLERAGASVRLVAVDSVER